MSTKLATPEPAAHAAPTARVSALTHLVFERPDLARAARFLQDFGLVVAHEAEDAVYLRGTTAAPYAYRIERASRARFVGFGVRVGSRSALEALAGLEGASRITPSRHPGGGEEITLVDPSGFRVEVTYGQTDLDALPTRTRIALGNVDDAPHRVNAAQRLPRAPAEVLRLGHVVLEVPELQRTCAFYTRHLGLIPSDVQVFDDGTPAVAFLRLHRGEVPSDHHTIALAQGVIPVFGHAAFEVLDADALGMGHRTLRERAWKHAWGIGRHLLGSQLFDYWEDPWGDRHEHYCDGDVFTADVPAGVHPVSREAMAQWGPPMPRSFTKPRLSPAKVMRILANVRRSPDLSLGKLRTLMRLFG